MNIIEKKLSEIIPYEKNPRKNDQAVDYVANSIKEFGFKVPIVIDNDNVIVCGHTRYKASRKLHLETVPCVIADDLTDEQIKAYRLADNKVSEKAEWDFNLLNEELDSILEIDMDDLGFEGFDNSYLDDLLEDTFVDIKTEPNEFTISFTFNKEYETEVNDYVKRVGKQAIVDMIYREVGV